MMAAAVLFGSEARAQCAFLDIAPTAMVSGSLAAGDCTIADLGINPEDASFVDLYRIMLPTAGYVTVQMNSAAFDTYLWIVDAALMGLEASDDDGGGGSNSRISLVRLEAGPHLILANSFFAGAAGPYTLTVQFDLTGNPECLVQTEIPRTAIAHGSLSSTDCTLTQLGVDVTDGSFIDQYRVTLPRPGPLSIELRSAAFDAFLWVFDETLTNLLAFDDDGTGTTDSLISDLDLPAGPYVILANSLTVGETGSYTLTVVPEPASGALGLLALVTTSLLARLRNGSVLSSWSSRSTRSG
jgi:hypothetical protein